MPGRRKLGRRAPTKPSFPIPLPQSHALAVGLLHQQVGCSHCQVWAFRRVLVQRLRLAQGKRSADYRGHRRTLVAPLVGLLFGGHLVAQSADAFNLYLYDVAGMHVQGGSFRAGPNNVSRLEGVVTGYFLDVQLPKVGRLRERWEVMNASTSDSSYAPARSRTTPHPELQWRCGNNRYCDSRKGMRRAWTT